MMDALLKPDMEILAEQNLPNYQKSQESPSY